MNGDMTDPKFILTEIADDSTPNVQVSQPHFGTDLVLLYIDYQKGSESELIIDYKAKLYDTDNGNQKEYAISYLNGNSEVVTRQMIIPESGTYRIPISVSIREHEILINFTFNGSGSFGDVEAYVKP
jgi:hypothetical protein